MDTIVDSIDEIIAEDYSEPIANEHNPESGPICTVENE